MVRSLLMTQRLNTFSSSNCLHHERTTWFCCCRVWNTTFLMAPSFLMVPSWTVWWEGHVSTKGRCHKDHCFIISIKRHCIYIEVGRAANLSEHYVYTKIKNKTTNFEHFNCLNKRKGWKQSFSKSPHIYVRNEWNLKLDTVYSMHVFLHSVT